MERQDGLDDLFAAARADAPVPSGALMARVLADALAEQPRAVAAVSVAAPARRGGLLSRLAGLFGGAGALAGLGTAAVAGLLIGYVQPSGLVAVGDAVLGSPLEVVDLLPDVDALLVGE